MARSLRSIAFIGVGLIGCLLATASLASEVSRPVQVKKESKAVLSAGGPSLTVFNFVSSPAILPAQFYLRVDKLEYPRVADAPKYDNRVKSHAQEWRDKNVKAKVLLS